MFAKTRLFHTADKSTLVHEDSEDAAFLYANTGDEIPESAAELYGLVDGDLAKAKPEKGKLGKAATGDGDKSKTGNADKGKKAGADKAGSGDGDKPGSADADKAGDGTVAGTDGDAAAKAAE